MGDSDALQPGRATAGGTQRYVERMGAHRGHFRRPDTLWLSSLALGTRQGEPGGADDLLVRSAVGECLAGGINVVDTALSDRLQTSERAVGAALRRAFAEGVVTRDEVVVVTKGGALTPDPDRALDYPSAQRDLRQTYVASGLLDPRDVVNGHCMSPAFLRDQIRRSRSNLGLATLDVFLLQEPELHLRERGPNGFRHALAQAFEALEAAVRDGEVAAYGLCTWDGLLVPDTDRSHLSISDLLEVALDVGAADHHLRAIQLPYGLAAGEGAALESQLAPDGHSRALLHTLAGTGTAVFASAPLYGGRLVGAVPGWVKAAFPEVRGDAHCALQFARSTANVTSVVVGMRDPEHVKANLSLVRVPPADPEIPEILFEQIRER